MILKAPSPCVRIFGGSRPGTLMVSTACDMIISKKKCLLTETHSHYFVLVDGKMCLSDNKGVCQGPRFDTVYPISLCNVDVCFAMDASTSVLDISGGWEIQSNIVQSIIKTIGT